MKTSSRRGFTLIELIVASAVALLAITAAMAAFNAQNQALQVADMARTANASSRDALLQLEVALRRAGWGVDPRYAFDFSTNCAAVYPGCRDAITGSDQLAFLSRSPKYQWVANGVSGCAVASGCIISGRAAATATAVNVGGKAITVSFPQDVTLQKDQQVMAVCLNGTNQVLLTMPSPTTFVAGVPQVVTFSNAASVPYNDTASIVACHGATGAALFVIDRFRFFVYTYPGTSTPWLVMDPMMDSNGDGSRTDADYLPVAKDVEDMQVAYVLNSKVGAGPDKPAGTGDWVLGNVNATLEEPDITQPAPAYSTISSDATRYNTHPANIRAVRLTLVVRSPRTDTTRPASWTGDSVPGVENRAPTTISGGRYRRYVSSTEVTLRNMSSTSPFIF